MVAKGKDASDLFAAVVKNVVSKNIEVGCMISSQWMHFGGMYEGVVCVSYLLILCIKEVFHRGVIYIAMGEIFKVFVNDAINTLQFF